jgi:hypothetical protein
VRNVGRVAWFPLAVPNRQFSLNELIAASTSAYDSPPEAAVSIVGSSCDTTVAFALFWLGESNGFF